MPTATSANIVRLRPWARFEESELAYLAEFGERTRSALVAALRGPLTTYFPPPNGGEDSTAIKQFYGADSDYHCLSVPGHSWLRALERQATEGFAHFLNDRASGHSKERSLAFLHALEPPRCGWPTTVDQIKVYAEHRNTRGSERGGASRVDLMIVAEAEGRRSGAVIEAKFGHDLSANPLEAYVSGAKQLGLTSENCAFLVLAIEKDRSICARLAEARNRNWSFLSWRRFLLALERNTSPEIDDGDYRRFRRTIFARSN